MRYFAKCKVPASSLTFMVNIRCVVLGQQFKDAKRHPFFLHLKGSDTILHLFMRTSSHTISTKRMKGS